MHKRDIYFQILEKNFSFRNAGYVYILLFLAVVCFSEEPLHDDNRNFQSNDNFSFRLFLSAENSVAELKRQFLILFPNLLDNFCTFFFFYLLTLQQII